MKHKEIETKYRADEMSFTEFEQFITALKPVNTIRASGYDYFYCSPAAPASFARHRVGPEFNQLTFKRKLSDTNNYIRDEHNILLDMKVKIDQVAALLKEFGYTHNSTIFKNVFVYNFDKYNFVYYVCYTPELKELGRFVEVEMSEEHPWDNEDQAWALLREIEGSLRPLGITPQHRMRKSLFEMFKK